MKQPPTELKNKIEANLFLNFGFLLFLFLFLGRLGGKICLKIFGSAGLAVNGRASIYGCFCLFLLGRRAGRSTGPPLYMNSFLGLFGGYG